MQSFNTNNSAPAENQAFHASDCEAGCEPNDKYPIRFTPKTSVATALPDGELLAAATSTYHNWDWILSPIEWSHYTFKLNVQGGPPEEEVESFLGKAESFISLRAVDSPYLNRILAKPLPVLKKLDIISSGSKRHIECLATTKLGHLTNFHFKIYPKFNITSKLGDILLGFLQGCLQLKVAFFGYLPYESTAEEKSTKIVSLPCLCSFTHESPDETFHIHSQSHICQSPWVTCGNLSLASPLHMANLVFR